MRVSLIAWKKPNSPQCAEGAKRPSLGLQNRKKKLMGNVDSQSWPSPSKAKPTPAKAPKAEAPAADAE